MTKKTIDFIERRKYIRFDCVFSINHRLKGEKEFLISESDNISLGGLMFFSSRSYKKEDLLEIKFNLPIPEKNISIINCQVKWIQDTNATPPQYLAGVQFIDMSNELFLFIKNCIQSEINTTG